MNRFFRGWDSARLAYPLVALYSFIATLVVLAAVYLLAGLPFNLEFGLGLVLLLILAVAAAVLVLPPLLRERAVERRYRALTLSGVDEMDGHEFEGYIAVLLRRRGFQTQLTKSSGDLGVDLVASRPGRRYAVQVKRQAQPVSRRAVSDAVAGMARYRCNAAMVITNNHFSPGAIELARSNGCVLVDRERLGDWIAEFRG